MLKLENIFADIPEKFSEELVQKLASTSNFWIERAVSPKSDIPSKIYDQDEEEFLMIIEGYAELELVDKKEIVKMKSGDYMIIPPHLKHKVIKTKKNTIWLAAFYK
jgi:cupin 2 domain-containing protein